MNKEKLYRLRGPLMEEIHKAESLFNDCSGYRARACLDGSFPSYSTLKYFAMPRSIRTILKKTIDNIDENIETYFLKFNEGDSLPMVQGPESSFYRAESTVLSGYAKLIIDGKETKVSPGDTIHLDMRLSHSVTPDPECLFLVELKVIKEFLDD